MGKTMRPSAKEFEDYFSRLHKISFLGRVYKRFFLSPMLYLCTRRFGNRIIEIGSGTGSGVLGTFPKRVQGLEINPISVEYCRAAGLNVQLIGDDGAFPVADGAFDACVLDNVLEHIDDPRRTLDECHRITRKDGGLIVAVPGIRGHESDSDHKKFYDEKALRSLDDRWSLQSLFSTPFLLVVERLSRSVKQYCLVATYKKV
jgi:SAM-dependent methyltransferase